MLLTASLVLLAPAVDNYLALRQRRLSLIDQGRNVRLRSADLLTLETRCRELAVELADWQQQAVGADDVEAFQIEIVDVARQAKCQVRHVGAGSETTRPWDEEASPYIGQDELADRDDDSPTPFTLAARTLSITVVGEFEALKEFLAGVQQMRRLVGIKLLDLRSTDQTGPGLQLQLELALFDLVDTPVDSEI